MKRHNKIILAFAVVGIIILAAYYIADSDIPSGVSSKTVTLVVDYDGNWTGSCYFYSDVVISRGGTGPMEFSQSLDRGTNYIRFSVQKEDGSSSELMVSILDSDRKLLGSASTTEAYGTASVEVRIS